jgi:hypothetical protein
LATNHRGLYQPWNIASTSHPSSAVAYTRSHSHNSTTSASPATA